MSQDIHELLVGVRRAQRLLAAYNRRLLDMAKLLHRAVAEEHDGLEFRQYWPANYAAPGKAGEKSGRWDPTQHWAWDGFPMAFVHLEWATRKNPRKGAFNLGLKHDIDSGFHKRGIGEPDPSSFPPAEECASKLSVWVIAVQDRTPGQEDWDDLYDGIPEVQSGQVIDVTIKGARLRYGELHLDMAELPDLASVQARLVAPSLDLVQRALSE